MTTDERQDENTEQNPVHRLITERDLTELVQQYGRYLQRYFLANGVPRDDVNDLAQDTFTVIWARRGQYDPQKARSFLHGTARNIMLAHNRKHYGRKGTRDRDVETIIQSVHPESDANKTPAHAIVERNQLEHMAHIVNSLPYPFGEIIRLRYIEGYKREHAADALNISAGCLYRYERRALEHLKDLMRQQ